LEHNYTLQEILSGAGRSGQTNPGQVHPGGEKSQVNKLVGICFVPVQEWEQIYDEDTAFSAGTVFPCLNKPFLGNGR
jgi:hypothetical protein